MRASVRRRITVVLAEDEQKLADSGIATAPGSGA
jgi:hypothetical protein